MPYYYFIIIGCIANNISLFSKDILVPSLPAMATDLNVTPAWMASTMSFFIIGMALSQLLFGALSDIKGRKPMLLWGMGLCFIGNYLSIGTNNLHHLVFWRFVAGFGAGASPVILRSMANDLYQNALLTKTIAYFSMTTVLSPLLAPILGGLIQDHFGWQRNLVVMTVMAAIALMWCFVALQESNPHPIHTTINVKRLAAQSLQIMQTTSFIAYTILSVIAFAPPILYTITSPFLFQNELGLTATQNGFLYVYIAVGYFIGAMTTNKLAGVIDDHLIMRYGITMSLLGGLLLFVGALFFHCSVLLFSIPMLVNVLGSGLLTPVANKQCVALFPNLAGLSAALLGFFRTLGVFLLALAAPLLPLQSPMYFGMVLVLLAVVNYSVLRTLLHHRAFV